MDVPVGMIMIMIMIMIINNYKSIFYEILILYEIILI
jgi:hypothetical protein